ncbi:MAG: glycosyltransferase [Candidatus Eisenbacteria bacterium]|nr:glycosyltransferase [Candidatus Latescibacterota bacterium]MBD3302519.1 glycosyltransferase [Candidatus Eisenbacteria bacterium]
MAGGDRRRAGGDPPRRSRPARRGRPGRSATGRDAGRLRDVRSGPEPEPGGWGGAAPARRARADRPAARPAPIGSSGRPRLSVPRKTIVHVITTLEPGGAQSLLIDVARRCDPEKYRIVIVYLHGRAMEIDAPRPEIVDLSRNGRISPFVFLPLARLLRREKADLVHTHLVHADIFGQWAAWLGGVWRRVTSRHYGIDHKEGTRIYRMADRAARGAMAVVAVSRSVAEHLVLRQVVRKNRIAVIPNGIDVERFDPSRFPRRERDGPPVLGAVGRLHPQKGFVPLLEIFRGVIDAIGEARLEIVGEGVLRTHLEAGIRLLGLEGRVRLLGAVPFERMPERYASWDLLLMPSRWEGFGLAAAEAMAMRRAVVASPIEGLAELVVPGKTGVLIPPGAQQDWIDGIVDLLRDPDRRAAMGAAGRDRILRHFTIERTVDALERLYDDLLGDDGARSRPRKRDR